MFSFILFNFNTEEENARFTELYEKYKQLIYFKAYEMLHDRHVAEDAVIETFFRVYKNYTNILSDDRQKIKTLLVIILKNVCIDMLRKTAHDPVANGISLNEPISDENGSGNAEYIDFLADPDNAVDAVADAVLLRSAVAKMPETLRSVLALKTVYGLSMAEIAPLLGISLSLAYKRLQRARGFIADRLKENE